MVIAARTYGEDGELMLEARCSLRGKERVETFTM
jgi:hypothetical protein